MRYKIQTQCTFGWGDLRKRDESDGTYTGEYRDYFFETKKEALSECDDLNKFLGGGFRVVPITTRSDHNLYE
jgi:hypothetical protein